ncbi:aldehyde dehydrogenase family protein [Pelosinus fermentans]|uniref:Aldehyde Dehydrogenase n=1 Tax=Pelosinus fermentans JBW45 TaxID=1192197 RepID=I8TV39_9FIRM|nr:aldehyde dehydrogenase family protein [Pelosinus fermentans]AJQ26596.1 Aldehyde Dehydrogenase [Pelosinus fermentans JBW45]
MINIPVIINNECIDTIEYQGVYSLKNEPLATLSNFPVIRIREVKNMSEQNFDKMRAMPAKDIFKTFKKAAQIFRAMNFSINGVNINKTDYIRLVSSCTGLPQSLIEQEIEEIAYIMDNLEGINSMQVPGGSVEIFDTNCYYIENQEIGFFPAGKNLTIKLPGNIPTICIYWLIPLSQKRPIILIPPKEDPFTHFLIYNAIKLADPLLASCISFLPCSESAIGYLARISDQLMIPESAKSLIASSKDYIQKTYFIHYGRSKFIITDDFDDHIIDAIYRRMTWNCGRTCTGLTSVIFKGDANRLAHAVVERIKKDCIDMNRGSDIVPMFSMEKARHLDMMIESYLQKGDAIDVTKEVRGDTRLIKCGDEGCLLPTVLLVKNKKSEIFGLELPFPFITIIEAESDEELIKYAQNTLILSVASENKELIQKLCVERSIMKVFGGKHIERGYNYYDPHEGYIADFTYQKKAVLF